MSTFTPHYAVLKQIIGGKDILLSILSAHLSRRLIGELIV